MSDNPATTIHDALARLERIEREAAEVRRVLFELADDAPLADEPKKIEGGEVTFAEHDLLEVPEAAARFRKPPDTVRCWCRESCGSPDAIGVKRGGRWLVSISRLRAHLNLSRRD